MQKATQARAKRRTWLWSLAALLFGLACSALATWVHHDALARAERGRLERVAERSFDAVAGQLRVCGLLVRSVQTLFLASNPVDPAGFDGFYVNLRPRLLFPSLQAIAYAERAPTVAGQPERFPTTMVAPVIGNERVLGLDVASQAANLQGLRASRDSNQPTMSAAFRLIQPSGTNAVDGVVIRLPAYTHGAPPTSIAERRARFSGSVAISFRVSALIERSLPDETRETMDVRVTDVTDGQSRQLFASLAGKATGTDTGTIGPPFRRDLRFGGRIWRMQLLAHPGELNALWQPGLTLAIGALASMLLALLVWSLLNTRERAVVLARQMAGQFRDSESRFRALNELLPTLVLLTHADGRIVYANQAARERLSLPEPDSTALNLRQVLGDATASARLDQSLSGGSPLRNLSVHFAGPGHDPFWASISVAPIDLDGQPHLLAVATDITEMRDLNEMLAYQASHDSLTGLHNRREFGRRLEGAIAAVDAGGQASALLYFDLDQFKIINDTSGHQAGDMLLTQLAAMFGSHLVAGETIARLGGDEFGILVSPATREGALEFAERMRLEVDGFVFSAEQRTYAVSVSIGVVMIDHSGLSQRELLSLADTACYMAKERGRNRVHLYSAQDLDTSSRRSEMEWASRLRQALLDGRFLLYYQEIQPLDPASTDGVHMELLIRLRGEDGAMVSPGAFIPAAERFGLMPQLDRWVVDTALANFEHLHVSGRPVRLCAINLSGLTFEDDTFADFVLERLQRYGVAPDRVCFEVTETAAVGSMVRAIALMSRLRAVGCKFSLDDFGAGMASFGYLKNLPVDYLKIDGSFIRNLETDAVSQSLVRASTEIGHQLGLKVVAEWVGDARAVEVLRRIGVDYGQGFFLHQPEPAGVPG
ncbi:MAG: EAL domain-containing protein [Arenimonas sp.]